MAAPKGNTFSSSNNRLLTDTLRRAVIQSPEKLRKMCDTIIEKAEEGDLLAAAFVFDRLEGKPVSKSELSGPDGSAIPLGINVSFK